MTELGRFAGFDLSPYEQHYGNEVFPGGVSYLTYRSGFMVDKCNIFSSFEKIKNLIETTLGLCNFVILHDTDRSKLWASLHLDDRHRNLAEVAKTPGNVK